MYLGCFAAPRARAGVEMGWDVGCHFSAEILGVKSRYRGRCARARVTPSSAAMCCSDKRRRGEERSGPSAKKGVNMEKSQPLMFHGLSRWPETHSRWQGGAQDQGNQSRQLLRCLTLSLGIHHHKCIFAIAL